MEQSTSSQETTSEQQHVSSSSDLDELIEYVPEGSGNPNPDYYRIGPDGRKIEITRAEFKEWRRQYVTRKFQRNPICGHKVLPEREPRHVNCEACWFAFFQIHGEFTQACDEVFAKHGIEALKQLRGPKLAKNFLKFMSTVAQWKKQVEAAQKVAAVQETDEQGISGSGSTTAEDVSTGTGAGEEQSAILEG